MRAVAIRRQRAKSEEFDGGAKVLIARYLAEPPTVVSGPISALWNSLGQCGLGASGDLVVTGESECEFSIMQVPWQCLKA
eukprot:14045496-Alexandrium_andersonii.AAC.1